MSTQQGKDCCLIISLCSLHVQAAVSSCSPRAGRHLTQPSPFTFLFKGCCIRSTSWQPHKLPLVEFLSFNKRMWSISGHPTYKQTHIGQGASCNGLSLATSANRLHAAGTSVHRVVSFGQLCLAAAAWLGTQATSTAGQIFFSWHPGAGGDDSALEGNLQSWV